MEEREAPRSLLSLCHQRLHLPGLIHQALPPVVSPVSGPLSPPLLQPPVLDLSCHQELGVQIVGNPVSPCNIPDVPGSVRIVFVWQREEGTGDQVPPLGGGALP